MKHSHWTNRRLTRVQPMSRSVSQYEGAGKQLVSQFSREGAGRARSLPMELCDIGNLRPRRDSAMSFGREIRVPA